MSLNRIISIALFLVCFMVAKSQDTLYRVDGKVSAVKITKVNNKIVDFLPWDNLDGAEHEISRTKVAYIVYQGGRIEAISDTSIKSTPVAKATIPAPATNNASNPAPAPKTPAKGNATNVQAPTPAQTAAEPAKQAAAPAAPLCAKCDPTSKFELDASVQLCGFKSSKDARYKGQKQNTFYVNDPDKKYLNCKQLICVGMDFSYMKLVNDNDIGRAADLKQKDMYKLCSFMNDDPGLYFLSDKFGSGKKVKPQMERMKATWKNLNDDNWILSDEYSIAPGKIPAIIRASDYGPKEGLAAVFILEKFSKPLHTVSGYWVIFDCADKKTLLIDHLVYSDVTPQIGETGWWIYWRDGLNDAQVWHPFDIEKYCDLEKKGQFEKVCGN